MTIYQVIDDVSIDIVSVIEYLSFRPGLLSEKRREKSMSDHLLFVLGFCFLLGHEMDAIRVKEWKIFPIFNGMKDESGYVAFTALHVPLYALLLVGLVGDGVSQGLIVGLDIFFIVHVVLHLVFYNHPENRFRSLFSYVLIFGAGVFGALDLLLML